MVEKRSDALDHTFFCRRDLYPKNGSFKVELNIAADHEMMVRLKYKFECSSVYVPELFSKNENRWK